MIPAEIAAAGASSAVTWQSSDAEGWQMGGLSGRHANWISTQLACMQMGRC